MRIGEFSKQTGTSIDAVRHYITLGLLVPTKEGKYFKFDSRCKEELERIKEMKDMSFSLNEIKRILLLNRFSKLTLGQERQHYRSFFKNKLKELDEDRNKISKKIDKLGKKIEELDIQFKQEPVQIGVELSFLSSFYCPLCQKNLVLSKADVNNNMIINGEMICDCNYVLEIKNGIIINHKSMKSTEETDESYFIRFTDETNNHFLDNLYAAMAWCHRTIKFFEKDNEVVLELGVGNGILASHIYNDLPDNVTYIAVDYDYYKLKYLKKVFERSGIKKNIIFICADYTQIPIKHKSVDYVVDFLGTTNYSYKNKELLHKVVEKYYKDNCKLIASFMFFDKFKINEEISLDQYHLFKKDNIISYLRDLGFKREDEYSVGYSDQGEKNDVIFDVTNRVYVYGYLGSRDKK